MTTFADGPAKGQVLQLTRAPFFLRVTRDSETLEFDALDQLHDTPRPRENLMVYERKAPPTAVHINRGKNGSGWYAAAEYQLFPVQPTDVEMRDVVKWRAWCEKNAGVKNTGP